jgi:hypothetical protein
MIEGSGSGSIPLTNGSGSGKLKNMWIRWIRIRNTGIKTPFLIICPGHQPGGGESGHRMFLPRGGRSPPHAADLRTPHPIGQRHVGRFEPSNQSTAWGDFAMRHPIGPPDAAPREPSIQSTAWGIFAMQYPIGQPDAVPTKGTLQSEHRLGDFCYVASCWPASCCTS